MKVIVIGANAGGLSFSTKVKRNLKDKVDLVVYEKTSEYSVGACGIPYFIEGMIEKASNMQARPLEHFTSLGINLKLNHEVIAHDKNSKTVTIKDNIEDKEFTDNYDYLVIATGARVNKFPPMDKEYENLFTVRSISDADKINSALLKNKNQKVLIIGAGFIGLEMTEAISMHTNDITLVDFAPTIMANYEEESTRELQDLLISKGIKLHLSSKVLEFHTDGKNNIIDVLLEGNNETTFVDADIVINCAGIKPNSEVFDLDKAKNGAIIIDEFMNTSIEDVFSLGDVAIRKHSLVDEYAYSPLGTVANKEGRLLADYLSGIKNKNFSLLTSSILRVFDYSLGKTGINEAQAKQNNINYKTNLITANSQVSYFSKNTISIKIIYEADTNILIGATVYGKGDVLSRVNYFALAIHNKMTLEGFSYVDLAYAPPFNGVWDASQVATNTAK